MSRLNIFVEVMKQGSFASVAKQRNLAPSTVSRAIASLEDRARVRLFERSTRKLEPTVAAIKLLQRLEPLLDEIIH